MSRAMDKYSDYWGRVYDNIASNFLEVTAITSLAQGKYLSLSKPFGVGKSSLALWISYILHYWERYGLVKQGEMDYGDEEVWWLVLKHMTYDKLELLKWASRSERIPALIWDDVQNTAPSVASVPEVDKYIASYLTTARTSIANIIMTMPSLDSISRPFRQIVNYEIIVYDRGKYEIQFIKTRKRYRNPYKDWKRLLLLEQGEFPEAPSWVYKEYLDWRETERRRVITEYMSRVEKRLGVKIGGLY